MEWSLLATRSLVFFSLICYLPRAGGSSPPYIGNGLGFRIIRRLHGCPSNLPRKAVWLEMIIIALFG